MAYESNFETFEHDDGPSQRSNGEIRLRSKKQSDPAGLGQLLLRDFDEGLTMQEAGEPLDEGCRTIDQARVDRIFSMQDAVYTDNSFHEKDSAKAILAPIPDYSAEPAELPKQYGFLDTNLFSAPLLNPQQEYHAFRQLHFLRRAFVKARSELNRDQPSEKVLVMVEKARAAELRVRNLIVKANTRLLLKPVGRKTRWDENHEEDFVELIGAAMPPLIRAVELFDYRRGIRFSTYATWAAMNECTRVQKKSAKHRLNQVTGHSGFEEDTFPQRSVEVMVSTSEQQLKTRVRELLEMLTKRECDIMKARFGLDGNPEGISLSEIGVKLGITKERVRQIILQALKKMRLSMGGADADAPDGDTLVEILSGQAI